MENSVQNADSHAKIPTQTFLVPFFMIAIGLTSYSFDLFSDLSRQGLATFIFTFGVAMATIGARKQAIGVQDRVIRLEERLRMQQLFHDDMANRIPEFTTRQLIALRFASDEELPDLARKVLAENISDQKVIKQLVQNWRADHQRV
ncbi:MAG: DUF6526 family protein [Longimicrobiales bacterium]|nr:DUF6526 family protein [Longimicrobiales bacterium]